jgi:ABC-2 type transport system permease protein
MMMGDRLFFSAMVIIPLLITVVAGYALKYEKLDVIAVAAVDEDNSGYSGLLLERLSGKEGIGLYITEHKSALELLERGKAEQVFIIKKGFEDAVKRGESKGLLELLSAPSSYSADFTREIVSGETIRLVTDNMAANSVEAQYGKLDIKQSGSFRNEVLAYTEALWEPEPLMTIDYKELRSGVVTKSEQQALPVSSASSAGLVTAFIMFYMLFGSNWLIEERMNGTIKRFGAGTGALAVSFWGGALALFAAGALQILLFSVVQKVFFGVALFSGPFSYLVLVAYLFAVTSTSMFLSSVLKTQAQLQAGAPVLALFTGFIGGCFWNFVAMPGKLAKLALLTPQGWALNGINSLLANSSDAAGAIIPILVLFFTALILMPSSYIIINMQLKR